MARRTSHFTHLGPNRWEGRGRKREKKEGEKGEGRRSRERSSTFSLNFPIEPSVSGGARDKVLPHSESFKMRPKTRSLDKLQDVGVFLLLGLILV